MERIAIIDHYTHTLYIDDVEEGLIDEQYEGQEEKYIEDNYTFKEDYSWDYIVDAQYFQSFDDPTPVEIDFDQLKYD